MLHGFRWQLIALVIAFSLFGLSLISRSANTQIPSSTLESRPTSVVPSVSSTAPLPIALPTAIVEVIKPNNTTNVATYREGLIGSANRMNPLFTSLNPVDRDISSLIFEGLTRINQYGEPVPSLAKSWVISADGLDYVIQLRDDVLWQDGVPFGAEDVLYTLSLLQSPDLPGDPSLGRFWRTVEVQQLDKYLIRFRLTQPLGSFLDVLKIGILPEHALRGTTAAQIANHPINLSPIGTGPYQLEAIRTTNDGQSQIIDLRSAPVYRARTEGKTGYAVDRISFRLYATFETALNALRAGEIDGLASRERSESATLLGLTGVKLNTSIEPTLGVLEFNWASDQTKFFRELRIRQALQAALDRSSIIQRQFGTEVILANSPLFPGSWAYYGDLAWPRSDVTVARQLLEAIRLRNSSDATTEASSGVMFGFSILTINDPKLVNLAQEIAGQWSQLSISVSVESVDAEEYQRRLNTGEFGAALVELAMGDSADPDVYQFWDADQYPDGKNYGGVDDRRIAEELERARADYNGINRAVRYRKFQQEFIGRAIAIPLYYPLFTYAVSPTLEGLQLGYLSSPAQRFANIHDWVIS